MAVSTQPGLQTLRLRDFSGGLNLQASPSELAHNETPDCLNITLDERGGMLKRLGLEKHGEIAAETGTPLHLYYSRALDRLVMQVGAKLYPSSNAGITWAASIKTFSTAARVGFCDFLGKLIVIHPADGVFTWDGTTFSAKVANSPNGNVITPWQNTLLSAGDPAVPTRLTRSDIGAITWPATPVTNDIRIKDDTAITALAPGSGLDPTAKGSLVIFKEESCYRLNDVSTTLTYSMLDPTYGASGPLCVALNDSFVTALSRRGIIATNGTSAPKLLSEKLEPLFRPEQLSFQTSSNWCAGVYRDRCVFSLRRASGTGRNDTTLELHPRIGWIVRHNFGMQAFANYVSNDRRLLGARNAVTNNAAAFDVFSGGTDDGAAITSYFQTPWFLPLGDMEVRIARLRVWGRGSFTIDAHYDYSDIASETFTFATVTSGMIWGSALWGSSLWGENLFTGRQDYYPYSIARAVSLIFRQTSSTSGTAPQLLTDGIAPQVGDFACYGIGFEHIGLEFA